MQPTCTDAVPLSETRSARAGTLAVSVILPVIDETTSLRETVRTLLAENREAIREILLIVCGKSTPEALLTCAELTRENPQLIVTYSQRRPYLGGAMQDAFQWARGTHVLMMASDLETDPGTVKTLIAKAGEGYDIVTATRWTQRGGFQGYNPVKYALNWIFQHTFRWLYRTRLSDLTYGFRIFRSEWVKSTAWEELRHAFLLETILKPLRLGARVVEIPTVWRSRTEGTSHNTFWLNFLYFRIAVKTRFRRRSQLLLRGQACD
jgi:glycosyltransferase involved in cell wall biosynthesis